MTIDVDILKKKLCDSLCADIQLKLKGEHLLQILTPFKFSDGDPYLLYLKELPNGLFRLTDSGHTIMHASYENEIDRFFEGTRGQLLNQVLNENTATLENGEIYIDTTLDQLIPTMFSLGITITKIFDLSFLNRNRAENTFYEDLENELIKIIDSDLIEKNYVPDFISNAVNYTVDFSIKTKRDPLFIFGILGKDKARLSTITLEHLTRERVRFESLLVFYDQSTIPDSDFARLTNVGGEIIASLDATDALQRKIRKRLE